MTLSIEQSLSIALAVDAVLLLVFLFAIYRTDRWAAKRTDARAERKHNDDGGGTAPDVPSADAGAYRTPPPEDEDAALTEVELRARLASFRSIHAAQAARLAQHDLETWIARELCGGALSGHMWVGGRSHFFERIGFSSDLGVWICKPKKGPTITAGQFDAFLAALAKKTKREDWE